MVRLFLMILVFSRIHLFSEKVLIITSAYNREDFIEIQFNTFKKFLKDDYEFVVFNDAIKSSKKKEIKSKCKELGIKCINIPQHIHELPYLERIPGDGYGFQDPSVRNSTVVQYALNTLGFKHDGIVAIIDSDMFLVREFSLVEYMRERPIAGLAQVQEENGIKIPYIWIGLAFLDIPNLPDAETINFNCGKIKNIKVDAGGYTYYYMNKHLDVPVKYFNTLHTPTLSCDSCKAIREYYPCLHNPEKFLDHGLDEFQIEALTSGLENVEFLMNGAFFHYRSGSNWDHKDAKYHDLKTHIANAYLNKILQ